ncbi:TPM domain-containing protein [Lacticaseibacillus kribbianus]|uniref:TPM domain-containing protein n=1 Tax=Lacticaseibacillus kribbianus TaxID=2926292 RepID=UPI001CD38530|nr:TPM domain-containing protein [Lacticaseibacillus kribbianus]
MRRIRYWLLALVAALALFGLAQPVRAASHNAWVNDHAGVLSQATLKQVAELNEQTFAKLPGSPQLAVETYDKIPGDDDIDDFRASRFQQLGVGHKDWDNGLYFVMAVKDRKFGLEVGYGLESAVPDGASAKIVTAAVKTKLRGGDYDAAMQQIVANIAKTLKQNRSAIMTPTDIKAKRAAAARMRGILIVVAELTALVAAGSTAWLVVRKRRRNARLQAAFETPDATLSLFAGLPKAERDRFVAQLRAPMSGPIDLALQQARFADYVRANFGELSLRLVTGSPYPLYVFGAVRPKQKAAALNAFPDFAALVAACDEQLAAKSVPFSLYQPAFEDWAADGKVTLLDQQAVWAEFVKHVRAKDADKLTVKKQRKTFQAILDYQYGRDTHTGDLPLWVGVNYAHDSASAGSGSDFGGGFGGGSSGGGGFSGGW